METDTGHIGFANRAVVFVFAPKNFLYNIPHAFCFAENMALEAAELGISSCIIARGEETFDSWLWN